MEGEAGLEDCNNQAWLDFGLVEKWEKRDNFESLAWLEVEFSLIQVLKPRDPYSARGPQDTACIYTPFSPSLLFAALLWLTQLQPLTSPTTRTGRDRYARRLWCSMICAGLAGSRIGIHHTSSLPGGSHWRRTTKLGGFRICRHA